MEISRRDFVHQSGVLVAGAITLPEMPSFAVPKAPSIQYFCPLWGSSDLGYEAFFSKAKSGGYDGVEMHLPTDATERATVLKQLKTSGLLFIGQVWQPRDTEVKKHIEELGEYLRILTDAGPLFINSHTGKDFFTFDQNREIIDFIGNFSHKSGVKVIHETHRGRFAFAAHITRQYLEKIPSLRLTFDVSHWMCVAESLLENQPDAITLAIEHTDHVHTRVGYAEGPQIPDPQAPEWQYSLNAHCAIWDKVVASKKQKGEVLTITCEFGPAPYMVLLPFTKQPIANQWETNVFMKDFLKKRYNT